MLLRCGRPPAPLLTVRKVWMGRGKWALLVLAASGLRDVVHMDPEGLLEADMRGLANTLG